MTASQLTLQHFRYTQRIAFFILAMCWFVLPFFAWVALTIIYAVLFQSESDSKSSAIMIGVLLSFSLANLIASREVGTLWDGVDDMPAYLMAFENYTEFRWMIGVSVRYAFHADLGFSVYSWLLAVITEHHKFFYFFLTVFTTYLFTLMFLKRVIPHSLLLGFLLVVLYFKFFHLQWHLIRSMMALPIVMYGLYLSIDKPWTGRLIAIVGGLFHFSTFAMSVPLLVIAPMLKRRFSMLELIFITVMFFAFVALVFAASKLFVSYSHIYMVSKILQRIKFDPSFAMLPYLLIFIGVLFISYHSYVKNNHPTEVRLFNIAFYYVLLGTVAIFVAGKELYRFTMPLFLIYSPLLIMALRRYIQYRVDRVLLLGVLILHLLPFSYVLMLNQAKFYYLTDLRYAPAQATGIQQVNSFFTYVKRDITYVK